MTSTNIFSEATRQKLRYPFVAPGVAKTLAVYLSVEDLWDLSSNNLDLIAIELDSEIRNAPIKSFVHTNSKLESATTQLKLKFDIVIAIIEYKKLVAAKSKDDKDKAQRKQLATVALANKTENTFASMTEQELKDIINE